MRLKPIPAIMCVITSMPSLVLSGLDEVDKLPERSPDLSCITCFLSEYLNALVYETQIDFDEDLIAKFSVATATICETSGTFEKVLFI